MPQVSRGTEISADDAAKIMRSGITGKTEDFLNEIADSLIDRLIEKEPEVSELIATLVYRKMKSLNLDEAIRSSVQKIADEEFQNNIMGVINMRVCKLEESLHILETQVYGITSDLSEVRTNCGKIVYKVNDWRGEDIQFTSTWTLSSLVDRIDWIQSQIEDLKTEVEENEK